MAQIPNLEILKLTPSVSAKTTGHGGRSFSVDLYHIIPDGSTRSSWAVLHEGLRKFLDNHKTTPKNLILVGDCLNLQ